MISIVQNTPEWLETKKTKIGGSEIYSLVYHYCKKELEALGINLIKEKPFKSALELFIKIRHNKEINDIEETHQVFGNGLEEYIAYRLRKELPKTKIDRSKEFVISDFHPLAACSPDGYIDLNGIYPFEKFFLEDFDKTCKIDYSYGLGMVELKTANYFSQFQKISNGGSRLQYIFQNQYNMRCKSLNWGVLTSLNPKEEIIEIEGVEFPSDHDFVKGWNCLLAKQGDYERLNQLYDLKYYIYPKLPAFQTIIEKALNAFQTDLDANKYPEISLGDLTKLEREKKLLAKLWPDKFGEMQADEELDDLINQRMIAHTEELKAKTEKAELDCKIVSATKKFTKIIGSLYKATYDKRGYVRFTSL